MPPPSPETSFAEATAVKPLTSHTYECNFPDDWCIGSVPHGGFITSVFLRVASLHCSLTLSSQNQPDTIALHLDFLRRTQTGPALFTVRDTKLGRQTSILTITLTQPTTTSSHREEVIGTLTQSNILSETGPTFPTNYTLTPPPLPATLSLLPLDKDENWSPSPPQPFSAFRRARQKADFYFPRSGQRSQNLADEWARLSTGEKWTNISLGYIADMWPMPVEAFTLAENSHSSSSSNSTNSTTTNEVAKYWYPTLLLNLDVKKKLPEGGVEWLFARVEAKTIKNGRMDLEVVILDEEGDIVALSHHIAFAVDAARNLAERKPGTSNL